jgi:hypothetical protein
MLALVVWWIISTLLRPATTVSELAWREPLRQAVVGAAVVSLSNASLAETAVRTEDAASRPEAAASLGEVAAEGQEAWWRARIGAARARVDQARAHMEALDARLAALARDVVGVDDPAQRQVLQRERSVGLLERETMASTLEQAQAAVATVEEAARRAGIPPGWIR